MKVFAFFLPQFHEIAENDQWWGKGFTEWTNVKKARSLYWGHKQPVQPMDDYYYNLLSKDSVKWQTDLMKQYHIDGLIYYHYYFCGKKLLEKPAENLLKWTDIDQPFFFCWANHSWYRSWDGYKNLLIEQTYGNIDDWEEHFQYLLPFFKDERYIKYKNKPIFMLFKARDKHEDIADYFNKRCMDYGFDGIFWIDTVNNMKIEETLVDTFKTTSVEHRVFLRAPDITYFYLEKNLGLWIVERIKTKFFSRKFCGVSKIYNGNLLVRLMIKNIRREQHLIHGIFFSWDNTPRHGKHGWIITPVKKKVFFNYMNEIRDDEFCFINAWNEWCEGMILEPTKENGYKYLEWIKEWKESNNFL